MSKLSISSFIKTLMPVLNKEHTQEAAFILLFNPVCDAEMSDIDLGSKKISNIIDLLGNLRNTIFLVYFAFGFETLP